MNKSKALAYQLVVEKNVFSTADVNHFLFGKLRISELVFSFSLSTCVGALRALLDKWLVSVTYAVYFAKFPLCPLFERVELSMKKSCCRSKTSNLNASLENFVIFISRVASNHLRQREVCLANCPVGTLKASLDMSKVYGKRCLIEVRAYSHLVS